MLKGGGIKKKKSSNKETKGWSPTPGGIAKETINAEKNIEEPTQAANPFKDKNVLLPIPIDEKSTNPNVAKDIKDDWN